ncbi:MAG: DUF1365 domain-containing protein [Rickettsiales bacterium]|nr:DUF1365 domain-containing protein [Rickettsiales bacterium]
MAIENGLIVADVVHARHAPRKHRFRHRVYYLCFPLNRMKELAEAAPLSVDRANLFSFRQADHAQGRAVPAEGWLRGLMQEWNITAADGDIVLLTMPRLLGYVFNPVSFWFCLDHMGQLRAVYSEVNNTFGEQHGYWSFHDDFRPIERDDILTSRKVFHVSPFLEVAGEYQFRFAYGEQALGVWIDHYQEGVHLLSTSLTGKREALTTNSLWRCFFYYPLVTLKVMILIHYHAFHLIAKSVRYRTKPTPPIHKVTR